MASHHSYAVQVISLWIGLVPAILALVVIVAARLEQRRCGVAEG